MARKEVKARKRKQHETPPKTQAEIETLQRIAADQQKAALTNAGEGITSTDKCKANIRVEKNADGTVDGWLIISEIKHGYTVKTLYLDLERYLTIPHLHWLSLGFTVAPRSEEQVEREIKKRVSAGQNPEEALKAEKRKYYRYKGLDRINVYPQSRKSRPDYKATNFLTARRLAERLQKMRGKPQQVIVRLFWNHENRKPGKR